MFVDEVTIHVKAGNGGNGCVAFRHEKFIEKGGPSGGNGGRGGNIVFVGDKGLTTLIDFKFHRIIKAKSGENGMPKDCYGADSEDVFIRVPLGTVCTDIATGAVIADITKDKEEKKVLSIIKEDGTKEEVELLICFTFNDTKKEYVVYTRNEKDENGNVTVYISSVDRSGEIPKMGAIESDEEWSKIKDVLRELSKND